MKFLTDQTPEPSDDALSQLPDAIQDYVSDLAQDLIDATSTIEAAYGYLFRSTTDNRMANDARKKLLSIMDKENQKFGIGLALAKYGPVSGTEMLMYGPDLAADSKQQSDGNTSIIDAAQDMYEFMQSIASNIASGDDGPEDYIADLSATDIETLFTILAKAEGTE